MFDEARVEALAGDGELAAHDRREALALRKLQILAAADDAVVTNRIPEIRRIIHFLANEARFEHGIHESRRAAFARTWAA